MTPLIAILGAGASRGSGDFRGSRLRGAKLIPPLTIDLFNENRYSEVLSQYDLAHQAGRHVTSELAKDDTLGLERAVHDLAVSDFDHHKRMAIALPLYLQHLLHQVSADRYTEVVHYDRLIERLLRLPYVFFVSLNYDVLLDRRLHPYQPLSQIGAYVYTNQNWSLIKPHGSINWFHDVDATYSPSGPPLDLTWDASIECEAPDASLEEIRNVSFAHQVVTATRRYPALAAPEGPDDKLVLPHEHRKFFRRELRATQEIDILVVGYSGLDNEILKLIANAERKVRRMTVVSHDLATGEAVLARFQAAGLVAVWPYVVDGDFASWSNDGGLSHLVDEYDGPYTLTTA